MSMDKLEGLLEKANTLPLVPGVYIMKNAADKVIYVGKSRKLRNRVSQYFQNSEKNLKTARMVANVDHFEYFVCHTEMEALTLENSLIKKYNPKYNIRLKDAKSYPYIKITAEEYPRILFTRARSNDKAKYFGPYTGVSTVFSVLNFLYRNFGIPNCKLRFPRDFGKDRPCIYYQMKQCVGLCRGDVSREEYMEQIKAATELLRGNTAAVRKSLEDKMYAYSDRQQYEAAMKCRDTIAALQKLSEKQVVVSDRDGYFDIFGKYENDAGIALAVLAVREGVLIRKSEYIFGSDKLMDDGGISTFFCDYYHGKGDIPAEILFSFPVDEEELALMTDFVTKERQAKTELKTPERGDKHTLCRMAVENAEQALGQYVLSAEKDDGILGTLAEVLGLDAIPSRIEAYDISNLGAEQKTAGMVVCEDGKMKKSDYRFFKIDDIRDVDDYGCMQEALRRRLAHLSDEAGSFSCLPDLILLDGGKGHVACVKEVLEDAGLDIPVFGMVKDDYHKTRSLCSDSEEIGIAQQRDLFVFLYRLQEEVHRFTVGRMNAGKRKTLRTSSLEKIPGIGAKKAKELLAAFGTIQKIRQAGEEELQRIHGISRTDAIEIYRFFHKQDTGE